MCGRFSCSLCTSELGAKLKKDGFDVSNGDWLDEEKYRPRYNVAPRSFVPVMRYHDNQLVLQTMKWGFVPSFSKTMPDKQPINARQDTLLAGSPLYENVKNKNRRCIVVADGFYEWKKLPNGKKTPYYTKRKDGELMLFAALYDRSHPEDWSEPVLYSTAIVTTDASSFFSFLHDRMPVILEKHEAMQWLDPSIPWSSKITQLMKPYEGELDCYQVTDKVGSVANESPDFIVPVDSLKGSISSFFGKSKMSTTATPSPPSPTVSNKRPSSPSDTKKKDMESIRKKLKSSDQGKKTHITKFFKQE